MKRIIIGLLLALCLGACAYGLTAAFMTGGGNTVYCHSTRHPDIQYCSDDYGNRWVCVIRAGAWDCRRYYP